MNHNVRRAEHNRMEEQILEEQPTMERVLKGIKREIFRVRYGRS